MTDNTFTLGFGLVVRDVDHGPNPRWIITTDHGMPVCIVVKSVFPDRLALSYIGIAFDAGKDLGERLVRRELQSKLCELLGAQEINRDNG